MKTQISRESHDPLQRYSGVYQQQGRMITDADVNEAAEIAKLRVDDALRDVVDGGAPRERGVHIVQTPPVAGGAIEIEGTHLYADGIRGVVAADREDEVVGGRIALNNQADFLNAPPIPPNTAARLYGDLWERTITHLEDSKLLDAGLHGADTCTRTRTMAQVKWGPDTMDPEDPAANPRIGNARLTAALRAAKAATNSCDPCAAEIDLDSRIGNYAFRLEVHDVVGRLPSDPDTPKLKWSSENGAEKRKVAGAPDAFKSGDWIWESFRDKSESEKHLGYHHADLVSATFPQREKLEESWPSDDFVFARRWDGYLDLERGTDGGLALAKGSDGKVRGRHRGNPLDPGDGSGDIFAEIVDSNVVIHLDRLELTLSLRDCTFLTGDYWLAVVREDTHSSGSEVLTAAPPLGVLHHYVPLASVAADAADGTLVPLTTGEKRRLHFPPLTDIRAYDVGYATDCPSGLFDATHDTVKKALDQICSISAQHVGYKTECPSGLFDASHDTVKEALDQICSIGAKHVGFKKPCNTSIFKGVPDGKLKTVEDTLKLLCDVKAGHVGYTPEPDCELLKPAKTVQEALDILCKQGRGECCHTVIAPTEDLAKRLRELLEKARHVCVCLLPGEYRLPEGLRFESKEHTLTICACGPSSTTIFLGAPFQVQGLPSFELCGVELSARFQRADHAFQGVVEVVGGARIRLASCHLRGVMDQLPLLTLGATESIDLSNNIIDAQVVNRFLVAVEVMSGFDVLSGVTDVMATAKRSEFSVRARDVGANLALVTLAKRRLLADKLGQSIAARAEPLTAGESSAFASLSGALVEQPLNPRTFQKALIGIRDAAAASSEAVAVVINDAQAHTTLARNNVTGVVSFYGRPPEQAPLKDTELDAINGVAKDARWNLIHTGCDLRLIDNGMTRWTIGDRLLEPLRKNPDGGDVDGVFENALAANNVLDSQPVHLVACGVNWSATRLEANPPPEIIGLVLADNALYVGTHARGAKNDAVRLFSATPGGRTMEAATLGLNIA